MATARSSRLTYTPGANVAPGSEVADLSRATWDELYLIAQSMLDLDRPMSISIRAQENVGINATLIFSRFFDQGVVSDWEQPPGQFDGALGIWSAPSEGLYLVSPVIQVPAFATAATKSYQGSLRITMHPISGAADRVILLAAGGNDDSPMAITGSFLIPLIRGDQVWFDLALEHETQTGTVLVDGIFSSVRQSAIR